MWWKPGESREETEPSARGVVPWLTEVVEEGTKPKGNVVAFVKQKLRKGPEVLDTLT